MSTEPVTLTPEPPVTFTAMEPTACTTQPSSAMLEALLSARPAPRAVVKVTPWKDTHSVPGAREMRSSTTGSDASTPAAGGAGTAGKGASGASRGMAQSVPAYQASSGGHTYSVAEARSTTYSPGASSSASRPPKTNSVSPGATVS